MKSLVAKSEKASQWIETIGRVKSQTNLGSPELDDSNYPIDQIVAYLDSSLGEEATIDLERSVLSHDELLAEIASCHAIREQLRISPGVAIPLELRQAIYDIRLTASGTDGSAGQTTNRHDRERQMEDLPFVDAEAEPDDADTFLSQSTGKDFETTVSIDAMSRKAHRRSQMVAIIIGLFLVAFLAFAFELGRQSGKSDKDNSAQAAAGSSKTDATPGTKVEKEATADNNPEGAKTKDQDLPNRPSGNAPDKDTLGSLPLPPLQARSEKTDPEKTDPSETAWATRPNIAFKLEPDAPPVREPQPIATVTNKNSIILKRAKDQTNWVRVALDAAVLENTELMVLAGTDAQLDLGGNMLVTIEGPARFTIAFKDVASDAEVINVSHGIFTVEANVADIDLLWERSDRRYRMTLPLEEAVSTVEFTQYQPLGVDSRKVAATQIDLFYAQSDRLIVAQEAEIWRLPESTAMIRVVSTDTTFNQDPLTGSLELPLPKIRDYTARLNETVRKNFSAVRSDLPSDQSLYDFLVQLKSDSKQERRFAAIAWLAASGNFSFFLDFLNDEKNRNNWRSAIEAVRAAIANHPGYADALQADLQDNEQAEGQAIYELIVGFSDQQLADGADAKLVKYLDSDSLSTRVLAIENLRQITDGRAYGYSANADRTSRRRSIERQWKKLLNKK
ncbi:MAG: hypothetical protein P8J33_04170, partial [Pirellulaceae bacterium]|nr:hypothetical protein [Pirellulaceae bacterium]